MTSNKDYLSQEEIDALLRQTSEEGFDQTPSSPTFDSHLSSLEKDALGEIGNITFGNAATALSTLLGKKVEITTPQVSLITNEELQLEFPRPHVAVHVNYVDGFNGINLLVIKTRDAQVIADLMMGGDGTGRQVEDGLEEIAISAVQEAMNQMMGSSATSMSTIFNRFVNISPPGIDILNMSTGEGKQNLPPEDMFVKISFRLIIGDLIDSSIMQLLPVPFAKEMVSILMGGTSMMDEPMPSSSHSASPAAPFDLPQQTMSDPFDYQQPVTPQPAAYEQPPVTPQSAGYQQPMMGQQPMGYPQQMMGQQPPVGYPQQMMGQPPVGYEQQMMGQQSPAYGQPPMYALPPNAPTAYGGGINNNRNVNVQPAQFASFAPGNSIHTDDGNLNLLLDIPLKVTVELGRTQKVIKDILEITQGSIIELDKLAGEPVDILVNNKLIAKGEVVVIDENFGVRVTDIINQYERLHKLQ